MVDTSHINIRLNLDRFDLDFYNTKEKRLEDLKTTYPFLFPIQIEDSVWINKRKNKDELELYSETQKVYNNLEDVKADLRSLFKHVRYYNKGFMSPKVITMLTNIDHDNRVIYADSLLLISLDAYLGAKHPFYNDYPAYVKQNNTKDHLIVDVANSIIAKQMRPNNKRTFVDKIIYEGKRMAVLDAYLPSVLDREKIGFQEEKYVWTLNNEEQIWRYFIEKDLLFSTDKNLDRRFIELAPFSKFYLEEDNQTPGRIGVWVGWQIVKAYMKNKPVSLRELINTSEEKIFRESKYKPRK